MNIVESIMICTALPLFMGWVVGDLMTIKRELKEIKEHFKVGNTDEEKPKIPLTTDQ